MNRHTYSRAHDTVLDKFPSKVWSAHAHDGQQVAKTGNDVQCGFWLVTAFSLRRPTMTTRHSQNNLSNPPAGKTLTRPHDQFYTSHAFIVDTLVPIVRSLVPSRGVHWVDFCAGTNDFLHSLAPASWSAFDIDPRCDDCTRRDWFSVTTADVAAASEDAIAVGLNPPFGVRTVLARRFIRHALEILAPEYFALVAPLSAWSFLNARYDVLHAQATPRNAFYTIDTGRKRPKNMRVTFVVLRRRSTPRAPLPPLSSRHIERARRTVPASCVADYDMFVATNGDGAAGRTFVVGDCWYHDGVLVSTATAKPTITTGMFAGIRFRNRATASVSARTVAERMPTMLPPSRLFTTPASVSLRDIFSAIDCILDKKK